MAAFPPDFLWGTSQSGHQIEGGNFASDWWRWEQRSGRIADDTTSKVAADFLHRHPADVARARDFGHNAFLFSVEWSRIEPDPGDYDPQALAYYRDLVDGLVSAGLEPVCILHHVTAPHWFVERYGWHHPNAIARFMSFAERIVAELASACRWWVPIREPMHRISMAHIDRCWPRTPPTLNKARRGLVNQARAHAAAYRSIHEARPDARVGGIVHARRFEPLDENSPWDTRTALREQWRCNRVWLDALTTGAWPLTLRVDSRVRNTLDFIGISFYGRETLRFAPTRPRALFVRTCGEDGSRLDSPAYRPDPGGLVQVLREISAYGLPVIVAANGLAAEDDRKRCAYLVDIARDLQSALEQGIDLHGYFHRSLLDGFEWHRGYTERWGLFHVDRNTLSRTPNASAFLFKELCTTGTISHGAVRRYVPDLTRDVEAAPA